MLTTILTKQDIDTLKKSNKLIECPHCGAQFLQGEIYMPGALIGKPVEMVRDSLGRIIYVDYDHEGNMPNMAEHFTCEYCDKPFIIEATITYKTTTEAPERDFSTEYVSLLDI